MDAGQMIPMNATITDEVRDAMTMVTDLVDGIDRETDAGHAHR